MLLATVSHVRDVSRAATTPVLPYTGLMGVRVCRYLIMRMSFLIMSFFDNEFLEQIIFIE